MKINFLPIVTLLSMSFLISSCGSEGEKGKIEDTIDQSIEADTQAEESFHKAKQVFYSLPSPIETAMLIKRAGAKYNEEVLNSTKNVENYTTTKSMALNLGVYSADLSFASLFDQTQTSIKYMSTSKKLADDLGILNAIDNSIIQRLEANINQKDSIMDIISETFMNSNSFLKENDRAETAVIILVGGWIEGLYIATQIAKTTESNKELTNRIIDQKLSLNTVLNLLAEYKDFSDINKLHQDLMEIKAIYDEIEIRTSKIESITDKNTQVTTLQAQTEHSMSDEVFTKLCDRTEILRNSIIK